MNREQSIRATFDIFKPEGVIEVRSMTGYTFSGYFRDREKQPATQAETLPQAPRRKSL